MRTKHFKRFLIILLFVFATVANSYAQQLSNLMLIADDREGTFLGTFERINKYAQGVTNDSYQLAMKLKARWNALNK